VTFGAVGAAGGAVGGAILGTLKCRCPTAERDEKRKDCYGRYLVETADCGSRFTDDYDYDRCMDNAWRNYIRCLNDVPSKPFVP
jgi:hypothetical protein